jgi:hypothetical protein
MAVSDAIPALAGAVIGGVATGFGSWLQARTANRAEVRRYQYQEEKARRAMTRRYLFQLQDSVDSLRRRMDNWVRRGGELIVSDPAYWEVTTLYALGRALAAERILSLEGAYVEISGDLRTFLPAHSVDRAIASVLGHKFFFYHRLALAEAMLEREPNGYRLLVFSEFRRRYDDPGWGLRDALASAGKSLKDFTPSEMMQTAELLDELLARLQVETQVRP